MRIPTALLGCVVLVALGCTNQPPPPPMPVGPTTELVTLKVAFEDSFPDVEGAKRIVMCQLRDERASKEYVGEGPVTGDMGAVTKYRMQDDPTLVFPRVLAKELKSIGFNVTPAERIADPVGGEPVRELLRRYQGDYLISGQIEELSVRARGGAGNPVFVSLGVRFDIFNKAGELRMYYPARQSDVEVLGDKAGDPVEINALFQRAVDAMIANAIDDPYFIKALDLKPETVKEMRSAKPIAPAGTPAETPAPPETPKTDAPKPDVAKELDDAARTAPK